MAGNDGAHGRRPARSTIALGVVILLVTAGFVAWQRGWADTWLDRLSSGAEAPADNPAAVAPPPEVDIPDVVRPPAVARVAAGSGPLDRAAVGAAVSRYLGDRDLGRHVVAAVAPLDGTGYAFRSTSRGRALATPASTTKVVTSTVALLLLGADHTFDTTTVLERGGGAPELVLVGGGDPFLGSRPNAVWGSQTDATTWPDNADVVTLARRTARSLLRDDVTRVRVGFDDSLFSGPTDNPAWEPGYVGSEVSPTSALWVDEGRSPSGYGRVGDPARAAADVFTAALGAAGVTVAGAPRRTTAGAGATDVASVSSAPLAQIVQRTLEVSDNDASEVLLRHIGLAEQGEGSIVAGRRAVERVLGANGVGLRGSVLHDGSGLSRDNLMAPELLVDVLRLAGSDAHPDLRPVLTGLPVAGYTGSLANRMSAGPPEGRGRVRAKTGTLTGVTSLAGIAVDLDGDLMVFALLADRVRPNRSGLAQIAMDNAAAALGACHCAP